MKPCIPITFSILAVSLAASPILPASAQQVLQSTISSTGTTFTNITTNSPMGPPAPGASSFSVNDQSLIKGTISSYASVSAASDYGENHASVNMTSEPPYVTPGASSLWADAFTFTPTSSVFSVITPSSVQYLVSADGFLNGNANAIYEISSSTAAATAGGPTTTNGSASASAQYSGGYPGNPALPDAYDYFSFGTSAPGLADGSANLVSRQYSLVNGQADVAMQLSVGAGRFDFGGMNTETALADYFDTATLTGLNVYDQNGNLIPSADYTVTDSSGTVYPFMQPAGNPAVPEPGSLALLGLGLLPLAWIAARRRTRTAI